MFFIKFFHSGILLTFLVFSFNLYGQINHEDYFTVTPGDQLRWNAYFEFIDNTAMEPLAKADSVFQFALTEYKKGQFSKTRELCEIALTLKNQFPEAHVLIGKAYVSSSKICNNFRGQKSLKGEVIWPAIDEWENAIAQGDKSEGTKQLIERYSKYLPSKEEFKTCWTKSTAEEGDDYFVGCWIQRETRLLFRQE